MNKLEMIRLKEKWKDALFHAVMIHRLSDLDWKQAIDYRMSDDNFSFLFMIAKGKVNYKMFSDDEVYLYQERCGIFEFDANFKRLDAEIYAYIDLFFNNDEKNELAQMKKKYLNF